MKLTAEHFPISCSLHTLVMEHFAGPGADDGPRMPLEELLGYLRNARDLDLTPYADLLNQTEEMGDPALPSREQTAVLRWIGEAVHQFERRFPLEEPLASQVRRLKPLAAAIALVDPDFLQPDAHPLHQLLDTIQERAVGWQSRLGRAGSVLEKQVNSAVEGALAWFEDHDTDLEAVCAEFIAAAERDQSRAQRMSRRAVEAELGRIKTSAARRDAAQMINGLLARYAAPPELAQFLKGPWYDSAQLVLLKSGKESEQWQKMSATTETLLDSVQSLAGADEERRQYVFGVVTQLPKEMRRWLLSLHHDTESVNDTMALVEFAHLRILRQQQVELEWITPIKVEASEARAARPELVKALRPIREGHWFGVDSARQETVRAQLVLKDEQEQRLIFTNLAGLKVLDQSFEEFDQLIGKQRVTALPFGGGFSLCLAIAAGLHSTEDLKALYAEVLGAGAPEVTEQDAQEEEAGLAAELHQAMDVAADAASNEPREEVAANEQAAGEPPATAGPDEDDASLAPAPAPGGDVDTAEDDLLSGDELRELESLIGDDAEFADFGVEPAGPEIAGTPQESAQTLEEAARALASGERGAARAASGGNHGARDTTDPESSPLDDAPDTDDDAEAAQTAASAGTDESEGWLQPPGEALQPRMRRIGDAATGTTAQEAGDANDAPPSSHVTPAEHVPEEPAAPEAPAAEPASAQGSLDLPMGTWLGFHDGATPLMAKLAVHDPEEDTYIFVNRSGIKMRQLSGAALAALIDQGMVDILQTASTFRQEVDEARKKLDT